MILALLRLVIFFLALALRLGEICSREIFGHTGVSSRNSEDALEDVLGLDRSLLS